MDKLTAVNQRNIYLRSIFPKLVDMLREYEGKIITKQDGKLLKKIADHAAKKLEGNSFHYCKLNVFYSVVQLETSIRYNDGIGCSYVRNGYLIGSIKENIFHINEQWINCHNFREFNIEEIRDKRKVIANLRLKQEEIESAIKQEKEGFHDVLDIP
jgi:hypothetical protein